MSTVVIVAGPTAVGKTDFAIRIAEEFGGEIVSCDSMQLYKYMDIGSAKPTTEERKRVRHHLVDQIDPRVEFSVASYQRLAKAAIKDVFSRGMLPIISGGTGLYLNSLLYDMDFSSASGNFEYRERLERLAEEEGNIALHKLLKDKDPEAAASIHPNNRKKVIRALERLESGEPKLRRFSNVNEVTKDYDALLLGLTRDRAELYDRINRRVDLLIQRGLVEEVKTLIDMGLDTRNISMKGIGYKEIIDYLKGRVTEEEAIELVKKNTRHYAKKQLTWFRRYDKMKWYNISDYDTEGEALQDILGWLRKRI